MDNHFTGTRIADILVSKNITFEEKKMFGGLCFMVDDKMLIGTYKNGVMARVDPAETETLTERQGASQMIHGGRTMAGYLFLESEAYERDDDLNFWVEKCLVWNPKVKKSKKKA